MTLQEIKAGDAARTRSLFERAITLQLPPKKMKVHAMLCGWSGTGLKLHVHRTVHMKLLCPAHACQALAEQHCFKQRDPAAGTRLRRTHCLA